MDEPRETSAQVGNRRRGSRSEEEFGAAEDAAGVVPTGDQHVSVRKERCGVEVSAVGKGAKFGPLSCQTGRFQLRP